MFSEILAQVSEGLHHNCQIDDWMLQEAQPPGLARDWLKKKKKTIQKKPLANLSDNPRWQNRNRDGSGRAETGPPRSVLRGVLECELSVSAYFVLHGENYGAAIAEHSSTRVVSKGIVLASSPRRSNPGVNAFRVVFDSQRVPSPGVSSTRVWSRRPRVPLPRRCF